MTFYQPSTYQPPYDPNVPSYQPAGAQEFGPWPGSSPNMTLPSQTFDPAVHDPEWGQYGSQYTDPSFGAPVNTLEPYVAPLGPQTPAGLYPSAPAASASLGDQVASSIGGGSGLINSSEPVSSVLPGAAESAGGLSQYLGSAGAGGLLGALKPSNIRAGFGETPGLGGLGTAGVSIGGNLLGQALVGHSTNPAVVGAGHGIKGAATGFGLGSLAAAGLVGANVLAPEVAVPLEAGAAGIGALIGLFGHKSKTQAATGFSTNPNDVAKNDLLLNQISAQQLKAGNLTQQTLAPLVAQYQLSQQLAGNDKNAQLQAQSTFRDGIVQAATSGVTAASTKASQLEQQSVISHMLTPYLRSNIQTGNAFAASEAATRGSLPPSMRAIADLEAHQAQSGAHQTAADLAASAQVGPGLQQLISAINQQNAIQNRQNALATTGASGSGSIIPAP